MKTTRLALLAAVVSVTALPALAQYDVWNTGNFRYNWLMDRGVTSSWGIMDSSGVSTSITSCGYGSVGDIQASLSNGQRVWIPRGYATEGTNNGAYTYYGQVNLGAVRPIEYLSVGTFYEAGMWFDQILVQFSNDPTFATYNQYTFYDGDRVEASRRFDMVKLDQVYDAQYVRVVFPTGHYGAHTTNGTNSRGGPGLMGIEAYSPYNTDITVDGNFNLAVNAFTGKNQSLVGTGLFGNGSQLGDGNLGQDNGVRSGASNVQEELPDGTKGRLIGWADNTYLTVELNDVYAVDAVRIVWNDGGWYSTGLTLQFSMTGKDGDWDKIAPVVVAGSSMLGDGETAAYITFDPREAKFVRWLNVAPDPNNPDQLITQKQHAIAQQFIVYGYFPVPEPATMTLLVLGGLAILRRRK